MILGERSFCAGNHKQVQILTTMCGSVHSSSSQLWRRAVTPTHVQDSDGGEPVRKLQRDMSPGPTCLQRRLRSGPIAHRRRVTSTPSVVTCVGHKRNHDIATEACYSRTDPWVVENSTKVTHPTLLELCACLGASREDSSIAPPFCASAGCNRYHGHRSCACAQQTCVQRELVARVPRGVRSAYVSSNSRIEKVESSRPEVEARSVTKKPNVPSNVLCAIQPACC